MKAPVITICLLAMCCIGPVSAKDDKSKALPPGLQHKIERGQSLPPGWQKKLVVGEILDEEIYVYGHIVEPIDRYGIVTIKIEDKVLRLIYATREIVDILR